MGHGLALLSIGIALLAAAISYAEAASTSRPLVKPEHVDAMPSGPSALARIEEIRRRVQEAVVYPKEARRRGIEGTARIQFLVGADGRATEVSTVESSGSALLDAAAERGAREAAPLPYVFGRLRIPVVFQVTSVGPSR